MVHMLNVSLGVFVCCSLTHTELLAISCSKF